MKAWNGTVTRGAPFGRRTLWSLDRHDPASPHYPLSLTMACERVAAGCSAYKLMGEKSSPFTGSHWTMNRRRKLQPVVINPLVVDLSHHNDVADFSKVKVAGIAGIIHKATEAIGFLDNTYAVRRGRAVNAGFLWGAYHFLRPVSIPAQVDFFLKIAAPDGTTLLALDHEDESVPIINAKEFLLRVEDAVGRKALLYSGSLIKEQLDGRIDGYLAAHRLWLAQYGPRPVTPRNWPSGPKFAPVGHMGDDAPPAL